MKKAVLLFIFVVFPLYPLSVKQMAKNIRRNIVCAIIKKCDAIQEFIDEHPELVERALLTCVLGGGSYWLWVQHNKTSFDSIQLKNRVVRGVSRDYNGVRLVQVEVKNQLDSDGGGKASCAYHAINNAEKIVGMLTGRIRNLLISLFDIDKINDRFGPNGRWRNQVKRWRQEQQQDDGYRPRGSFVQRGRSWQNGDWLHGEEINRLMGRRTNAPAYPYDVIDDIEMLGLRADPVRADRPWEAAGDPIVPAVQEALQLARAEGREYIHQFLINTSHHFQAGQEGAVAGYDGHWFSVVLHQSPIGERTYIIAESYKNDLLLQDQYVLRLVDTIERQ